MENYDLIRPFRESLIGDFSDPFTDVLEASIDSFMEDGIIKEIPIIKFLYAGGKTVLSIRDKYLCKRLLVFIQEFRKGNLSQNDLERHIGNLSDDKKMRVELERVFQYIDLCTEELQAKYHARFYLAFLRGEIDWETFNELAEANRRMFLRDYSFLHYIYCMQNVDSVKPEEESSVGRLSSLGLLSDSRLKSISGGIRVTADYKSEGIAILEFGKIFCKYLGKD